MSLPDETDERVQAAFEDAYLEGDGDSFSDVPVIPTGIETLSDAWVRRWAEWIAAGRPDIAQSERLAEVAELDWNPALHPRGPNGQFVERPFDLPDDAPDFGGMSTRETLGFIQENDGDLSDVFDPDSPVTVDGVPNDATSLDDVGGGAARGFADIDSPDAAREVATERIESAVDTDVSVSLRNMDTDQAQTLTESIEELSDTDAELFSAVDEIRDHDINATASAAYDPGQNALTFGPASMSGNEAFEGYLAENNGFGTIAHEVGHAAHYGDSGEDIFDYYFWPEDVGGDDIDQIEDEVSEYAAESPEEFVAEAFSVIASGGELSDNVANVYQELNGPQLE